MLGKEFIRIILTAACIFNFNLFLCLHNLFRSLGLVRNLNHFFLYLYRLGSRLFVFLNIHKLEHFRFPKINGLNSFLFILEIEDINRRYVKQKHKDKKEGTREAR